MAVIWAIMKTTTLTTTSFEPPARFLRSNLLVPCCRKELTRNQVEESLVFSKREFNSLLCDNKSTDLRVVDLVGSLD